MTASILRKTGYRTGLYTSPYIFRFHESMQVDGLEITDEEISEITEYVNPLQSLCQNHLLNLSWFAALLLNTLLESSVTSSFWRSAWAAHWTQPM